MSPHQHRLLIDGESVPAAGGREYDNINPATEEVIGTAPDGSAEDMQRAIGAARRAFDAGDWANDPSLRRASLMELQATLRKRVEEIRPLITAEAGTPVSMLHAIGVDPAVEYFSHYLDVFDSIPVHDERPPKTIFGTPTRVTIRREPVGVVGVITPWNMPFELNLRKAGAALAAGCTVVLKPAPETPWSGTLIAAAAVEAGLPPGVLNVVTTSDNSVAEILTRHADVDQISFTGSTATGRRIMAAGAETVKRVSLELGGKSAAIVLDDADLQVAVASTAGSVCVMAGQGCTHLTRLLVPSRLLGQATEIARAAMEALPYGDPLDMKHTMGPLISARQMERVLDYMEIGKQEATLVTGGGRATQFARGYYVQPTLFTDVPPTARIATEEIFGPVLAIIGYEDEDDAVRIANDSIFGLSGAVFGADVARAEQVAFRLRTGTVAINNAPWFDVDTPFGGYKQSGLGREFGVEGLQDHMEIKAISAPVAPVQEPAGLGGPGSA